MRNKRKVVGCKNKREGEREMRYDREESARVCYARKRAPRQWRTYNPAVVYSTRGVFESECIVIRVMSLVTSSWLIQHTITNFVSSENSCLIVMCCNHTRRKRVSNVWDDKTAECTEEQTTMLEIPRRDRMII